MPICSLAAATCRSAAAMSGRRSSSDDGAAVGPFGLATGDRRDRNPERGGGLADQRRDRVLEQRAPRKIVVGQRARGLQLGLGAIDVHRRGDLAGEAVRREREGVPVGLLGVLEQPQVAVDAAQRDIGVGELAVQAEAHVLEQRRLRLRIRRVGLDRVVHATPRDRPRSSPARAARCCRNNSARSKAGCDRCGAPTACCPTASSAG